MLSPYFQLLVTFQNNFPQAPSFTSLVPVQGRPEVSWVLPWFSEGHSERMSRGHEGGPRPSFPRKGMLDSPFFFFPSSHPSLFIFPLARRELPGSKVGGLEGGVSKWREGIEFCMMPRS